MNRTILSINSAEIADFDREANYKMKNPTFFAKAVHLLIKSCPQILPKPIMS